ncbi:MAG: uroporphyrinogen-III synthase [Bermanella sp.]|jgi:uroporphyrinogen-III synthase
MHLCNNKKILGGNLIVSHKKVLITRPEGQQHTLMNALTRQHWQCFHQPLVSIHPITESDKGFYDLKNKIMNIDLYDIIITVTSNASSLAYEWIDQYWPQIPINIQWFAVGKSSAQPLLPLGMNIKSPVEKHSEGLLALPELQDLTAKKVLILRGTGGRELIAQTLTARGANVSYAELYKRQAISVHKSQLSALLTEQQIHYALVTSGEMAQQLANDLLPSISNQLHLIIPSQRIYDNLINMNLAKIFAGVHVCTNLDAEHVISFLDALYQQTEQV